MQDKYIKRHMLGGSLDPGGGVDAVSRIGLEMGMAGVQKASMH